MSTLAKKTLIILCLFLSACSPQVRPELSIESQTIQPVFTQAFWKPEPLVSFQIQFSGEIDITDVAEVIELDAFETTKEEVELFHLSGRKVICYLNAGSMEDWRPDANQFPQEIIGNGYQGWHGEYWLDIRQVEIIEPILAARIEMCAEKGFDAVEFDNVDGYQNNTGFQISADDQLKFNRWLAETAHLYHLAVGLKNDPDQIIDLEPWFDFAILESCFAQNWCESALPFIEAGKAVFVIEYESIEKYCVQARELSITLIQKHRDLDAWMETCP